jgi:hypothetical protein
MNGEGQRTLRSYSEPMDLIGEASEFVSFRSCPPSCNLGGFGNFSDVMHSHHFSVSCFEDQQILTAVPSLPLRVVALFASSEVYGDKWWRSRGDNGGRDVAVRLDALKHYRLFETSAIKKGLRGADEFMMRTTVNQREWQYPPNVDEEALERNKNR